MNKKKVHLYLAIEVSIFLFIALAIWIIEKDFLQNYQVICFWIGGVIVGITILMNFILNKDPQQLNSFFNSNIPTSTDEKAYQKINRTIADEQALDDFLFGALSVGAIPIGIGILIGKFFG